MNVLTYTSYKEHFELNTEIYDPIAVNSCQAELSRKDILEEYNWGGIETF